MCVCVCVSPALQIVETFEALSNLAEIMAAKIRTTTDQLERSRTEQTNLRNDLEKLQVQKRALQVCCAMLRHSVHTGVQRLAGSAAAVHAKEEHVHVCVCVCVRVCVCVFVQVALQRRDELVRNMSGVPKGQRQDPAAAYQSILLQVRDTHTHTHTHAHVVCHSQIHRHICMQVACMSYPAC